MFNEVPGQEKLMDYLTRTLESGAIGHAYAFDGPPGIGKLTVALAFSKAILCRERGVSPCGQCASCIKVSHMNHPDLHIVEPEGVSIKNKQVEDFQHELQLRPYESKKKIFIIKNANGMTASAQNRLLKTLEEPPEYAVIILLSSNINGLLPTIKSRCQILKFKEMAEKEIERVLITKHGLPIGEARVMAAYSHGNIGNALKLMEAKDFKQDREEIIQIIDQLLEGNEFTVFQVAEFFQSKKERISEYLDILLYWFRDILFLKEVGSQELLINVDKVDLLQKHTKNIATYKISTIMGAIEKTKKDIKSNVNFQLAIEVLLLRIQEV